MRGNALDQEDFPPSRLSRALGCWRAISWSNLRSGTWWRRWFKNSIYQSGRLSAFLGLILLLGFQVDDPAILQVVRARIFDYYQQLQPRAVPPDNPVVIIDIDEKSIAELGQWVWPRTIFADLITKSKELGVAVIGFDVVWSEEDGKSINAIARSVPETTMDDATRVRLGELPSNDQILAKAIADAGNVVLGQTIVPQTIDYKGEQPLTSFAQVGGDPKQYLARSGSILRPLPVLDQAAAGRGVFSITTLIDGIVRQVPMVVTADDAIYPSLSLEMLRTKLGGRTIGIVTDQNIGGISQLFVRPPRSRDRYDVSTDARGQVWVYFRPHSTWISSYVSAVDIIKGRIPREALEGKFAVVGTSAVGLQDLRSSPLDQILPGVEVHANILENVLFKAQLTRPPTALALEWLSTLVIGLLVIVITPAVSARVGVAVFVVPAATLVWYSWN